METGQQVAGRLKEVILDGKWIATTNVKEVISGLTWQQATQKVGTANTIALLTFHLNYYIAGVLNVFDGGKLDIRDKFSFDCPNINSESSWLNLRNELFSNTMKFVSHVEMMSNEQLESTFVKDEYGTYRRNIEGMIEHAYYHFGQMVLLKKLLRSQES